MDAAPLVDKLRASGAQAAFPVSYLNDSVFIIRSMRQQHISIPVIGGGVRLRHTRFREGARLIRRERPFDLADKLRSRRHIGGPVPEAVRLLHGAGSDRECSDSRRARAGDRARKVDQTESNHRSLAGTGFEGGWTKAMPGGAVQFDQNGLNTLVVPVMVQRRKKDLVTVWPKDFAKASPVWRPS
jgi:branched-chain amino acid transport system substrate-binding protein